MVPPRVVMGLGSLVKQSTLIASAPFPRKQDTEIARAARRALDNVKLPTNTRILKPMMDIQHNQEDVHCCWVRLFRGLVRYWTSRQGPTS